jgi:Tol biopolymer transport system component
MATVYLAHDTRHERDVAIKVLHPELGAVLGADRFLSEIRTTARLQHPHILPLLDSGDAGGLLYYVMPLVTGETLRARLERERQLPVADAVSITREVADALGYAHGLGVIHRDIKPENILLQGGHALVADFGIALAVQSAGGARMTQTGLSLGTPQYMSPEQAMGERAIDARSDIYSLGVVTYEMLAGQPPFTGATVQAIVARVMTERPAPLGTVRDTVPPNVEHAVLQALAKLPADRFQTATAFSAALGAQGPFSPEMAAGLPSRTGSLPMRRDRMRDPLVLALAAVALVAIAAVMLWRQPSGDAPLPVARFELVFPDSVGAVADVPIPGAISPDGTTIAAFGIASATQESGLYLRKTDQLGLRLVPGTAQAYEPAFSPDGTWLAFMREDGEVNHLVKYRLADGKTEVVATTNSANGMDWVSPNELVLGQDGHLRGLSRLSAAGGGLTEFTHPDEHDQHAVHLWPVMANDGKTVVFAIYRGTLATAELAITSVPEGKITRLGIRGIRPLGILDDHLVFVQADGAVMAAPIDIGRRRLTGDAIPVHEPVDVTPTANGNSTIAMGRDGALLVFQGSFRARLAMAARGHAPVAISNELHEFTDAVPSPDRSHIAFVSSHARPQIGVLDVATGAMSRFSTAARAWSPSWLADGKTLMYLASDADGRTAIMRQRLDAVAPPDTVYAPGDKTDYPVMVEVAAAPDGTHALLVAAHNNDYFGDLLEITLTPDHPATARPFVVGPDNELSPAFSPDGRWVSFVVRTPTGGDHLMVRSFPEPTSGLQISPDTLLAGRPFWSADGQSVGYQNQIGSTVFETRLKLAGGLAVLSRAAIPIPMPTAVPGASGPPFASTSFSRDGALLGIKLESLSGGDVVVPNWITELRERIAASAAK